MASSGKRRGGRRARKRRRAAGAPANVRTPRPSRSAERDAAALEPLAEGERPTAVTVGAIVALTLGLATLGFYLSGQEVSGRRPHFLAVAQTTLMLVTAYGMWRAKYWAVLGMQTLLGLFIVIVALSALTAENVLGVLLAAAIVAAAGTLFWFLVKALARIQMPRRAR